MKNYLITIIVGILTWTGVFCQEKIISSPLNLKEFQSTTNVSVVDLKNSIHIFFISDNILDNSSISEIIYNPEQNTLLQKQHEKPVAISFKDISGVEVNSDNTISLFFHSKGKGQFTRIIIDDNRAAKADTFELKLKKEKVIQYMSYENTFSMLTVQRNSSTINHYAFNGSSYEKKTFDFNNERFFDKENKLTNLDDLLSRNRLTTLIKDVHNQPITYGKYAKIYPKENGLTITLNHRAAGTRTLHIDLANGKGTTDYFNIPTASFSASEGIKANSYLTNDGKIFSIITSKSKMIISVTGIKSKEVINEFSLSSEEEMPFKITRLIDSDKIRSIVNKKDKIKESKKFLKSLVNSVYVGLAAYQNNNTLSISVGGYSQPQSGFSVTPGGPSSTINTSQGPVTIGGYPPMMTFNPGNEGYTGFDRKLVMDATTFEIINKKPSSTIHDQVQKFVANLKRPGLQSLIRYKDGYVLGYYTKKDKVYHLTKFEK